MRHASVVRPFKVRTRRDLRKSARGPLGWPGASSGPIFRAKIN
jgi:hypothetical protein